jgi:hypothetical protein
MRGINRRGITAMAGAAIMAVSGLVAAQPALAAGCSGTSCINTAEWAKGSPAPSYGDFINTTYLPYGTHVTMYCWDAGQYAYGQYKWFGVEVNGNLVGFIPAPTVSNQTTVGLCPLQ